MRVDLGATVYGSDGDKVGSVGRIVLDTKSKDIQQFIVEHGFLGTGDKLVDIDMVNRVEGEDVYLTINSEEFKELSEFVEEKFVVAQPDELNELPYLQPSAGGAGLYLWGEPYLGRGYDRNDSMFTPAPSVAPVVETRSNIREVDTVIGEGTDVYGADGDKLGTVDQLIMGDDGALAGILVKKGLIFRRDVRIPADWIEQSSEDAVVLSVTAAEAETRSFDVEDSTL